MIPAFLAAQMLDTLTFLIGVRHVGPGAEIGPIGSVWSDFGDAGAILLKLLGITAILATAYAAPRYRRVILVAGILVGMVGAGGNLVAMSIESAGAVGPSDTVIHATFLPISRPAPELVPLSLVPTGEPDPAPMVTATPAATPADRAPGLSLSGIASWHCLAGRSACTHGYPSGMYAAAGPALRVGDWRGSSVTVCRADDVSRCVTVTLIDWCQCYGERLLDLYSSAFERLAPLSRGVVRVAVDLTAR